MAFEVGNLGLLTPRFNPGLPGLWVYRTNDTVTEVRADTYWNYETNPRLQEFVVNDVILVHADLDGTPATQLMVVIGIDTANKRLQVSDGIAITRTNT